MRTFGWLAVLVCTVSIWLAMRHLSGSKYDGAFREISRDVFRQSYLWILPGGQLVVGSQSAGCCYLRKLSAGAKQAVGSQTDVHIFNSSSSTATTPSW